MLQPLLQRTDLGGHELRLIQLALIWLARAHKTYGAGFVLEPLIGLAGSGKQADQVFDFSLACWRSFTRKKVRSLCLWLSWVALIIESMHRRSSDLPWPG